MIDKKYLIFDMDGVLIDSMLLWYKASYQVMNKLQNEFSAKDVIAMRKETYAVLDNLDVISQEKFLEEWYKTMTHNYEHAQVKEGVFELLEYCKTNGIKVAVATSTPKKMAMKVLEDRGISKYLDKFEDEEESQGTKPSAKIFLDIANYWNVKPNEVAIFEDNIRNVRKAKELGFYIVGVYDEPAAIHEKEYSEFADLYIHSFKELL